jgi:hypothetical protein
LLKGIGTWRALKELMLNFSYRCDLIIWNSLVPRYWPVSPRLEVRNSIFWTAEHLTWFDYIHLLLVFCSIWTSDYQAIGISTDCLSIADFSKNKHPLATSLREGPTHVCSTNRPHWDRIPLSLHLLLVIYQPVKQTHLQKYFKRCQRINVQSKWATQGQHLSSFYKQTTSSFCRDEHSF